MNWLSWPYWFELAVMFGLCAIGGILLGHFEERTPKWRKVLKVLGGGALAVALSAWGGRTAFFVMLGLVALAVLVIHAWWLPVRRGINGWTAEPREKYYALRGWKRDR